MGKKKLSLEEFTQKIYSIMKTRYGLNPNDYDETPEHFCSWTAQKYDLTDIRDTGFGLV